MDKHARGKHRGPTRGDIANASNGSLVRGRFIVVVAQKGTTSTTAAVGRLRLVGGGAHEVHRVSGVVLPPQHVQHELPSLELEKVGVNVLNHQRVLRGHGCALSVGPLSTRFRTTAVVRGVQFLADACTRGRARCQRDAAVIVVVIADRRQSVKHELIFGAPSVEHHGPRAHAEDEVGNRSRRNGSVVVIERPVPSSAPQQRRVRSDACSSDEIYWRPLLVRPPERDV